MSFMQFGQLNEMWIPLMEGLRTYKEAVYYCKYPKYEFVPFHHKEDLGVQ